MTKGNFQFYWFERS